MNICKLTRSMIFASFIFSGYVQAEHFVKSISEFIDIGAAKNLSNSPIRGLSQCKILLTNEIKNSDSLKGFANLKFAKEFVIYFVANRSWHSFEIYYIGVEKNKGGVFIFNDDDLKFKKILSFKEASGLISSMGDPEHFEYNSSPGVQDGNCSLFVYRNVYVTKSVILTPGGSVSAPIGDPIGILKEWAETVFPKQ